MSRFPLFAAFALLSAGAVFAQVTSAQVTDDPRAAAPVVYSDAPPASDCGSPLRNGDGSPVMNCEPQAVADEAANGAERDDVFEEPPTYDSPYYDTADYDTGDYYPGVSLLPPYGYASYGFGWGWPYYGYSPFGFGPYFNFAFFGGGFRHGHRDWHGHDGGNHHDGHGHGYHGPYRYVGNGRYWDETHPRASAPGAAASRFAGVRGATSTRVVQAGVEQNRASFAPRNFAPGAASATRALPSASYYSASRGMTNSPARTAVGAMDRSATTAAGARSVGARNPNWVTSLPSSRYSASARATNTSTQRAYAGYGTNRGYAGSRLPQNAYAPRTGYGMPRSSVGYRNGYGGAYAGRSGLNASHAWSSHAGQMSHAAPRFSGSSAGGHSSGGHTADHRGR